MFTYRLLVMACLQEAAACAQRQLVYAPVILLENAAKYMVEEYLEKFLDTHKTRDTVTVKEPTL